MNKNLPNRRSIRLQEYDYSQDGLYFITICVQDKACLFGGIENDEMVLNEAGRMVKKWCAELSHKFPDIIMDTYIIMPNHFHAIIINIGDSVGADLCVCPENKTGEHIGSPLHRVIQWLKTMTTNEYIRGVKSLNWIPFDKKLWQRNYYEHIIRNEKAYDKIAEYILSNPHNWVNDDYYNKVSI